MRLEQLTLKIEHAGIARRGVDLFQQFMPADVKSGVVLLPSLAGSPINYETPGWRRTNNFQLIVRNASVTIGYKMAVAASAAITNLHEEVLPAIPPDIPSVLMRYVRPKCDVIILPRSPTNFFEFSVNFEAAFSAII